MDIITMVKNDITPIGSIKNAGSILIDKEKGTLYVLINAANSGDTIRNLLLLGKIVNSSIQIQTVVLQSFDLNTSDGNIDLNTSTLVLDFNN
jgi:hypothetical protein